MKIKLTIVTLLISPCFSYADIGAVEGLKNMLNKMKSESDKSSFVGKCENLNKDIGPHEILKQVNPHQYIAAVRVCDTEGCTNNDALVVETSMNIEGPGQLNRDLWVQKTGKEVTVKDVNGFDRAFSLYRESMDCAVQGSIAQSGKYAIAFAAKDGDLDLVKALESKGQDINIQDSNGISVLDIAQKNHQTKVVDYLKSRGAKNGSSDLSEKFVKALIKKDLKTAKELMKSGLNPNTKYEGASMLYIACRWGDLEMIKYLVEQGAKVDEPDKMGITPLIVSAYNGQKDIVQYLISKQADVNHVGEGNRTPSSVAIEAKHYEIVKILKSAGAK